MAKQQVKVGITGAYGLIGWHLRCFLEFCTDYQVICAGRTEFSNPKLLDDFTEQCDVLVHLAGQNRGDENEIFETNIALAQSLVESFQRNDISPQVIFSSSIHANAKNKYGESKRRASELIAAWAGKNDAIFTNVLLPHVFGEGGKPFYNSVVSTFCHQLANDESPSVDNDSDLELLHAQDVAELIVRNIGVSANGDVRPAGRALTVSELLSVVKTMAGQYAAGVIPDVSDKFQCQLFNTYRSYLFPSGYPGTMQLHEDNRGSLFEAVKNLGEGQTFLSTTKPGITRGNHFHFQKIERFVVVKGDAVIRVRRLFEDDMAEFVVSGDKPQFVDMPTLHTHNITNSGAGELVTLFWSNEIFDPKRPDTYAEAVERA